MPLSPVSRADKRPTPPEPHDKMPIVLPMANVAASAATPTSASVPRAAPVRLLPATGAPQESRQAPPPTIEDNIEKNLLSFLRETRDLEWENVTVIELKRILRQYELNATGKKADLMQRIKKIRKCYRHLEEATPAGEETGNDQTRSAGGSSDLSMPPTAAADSSPDTMGSDAGIQAGPAAASGAPRASADPASPVEPDGGGAEESLDSLFSSALDLPPGQDLLFS